MEMVAAIRQRRAQTQIMNQPAQTALQLLGAHTTTTQHQLARTPRLAWAKLQL
jgi:hypothetical protein